jgi:hypothetical protein
MMRKILGALALVLSQVLPVQTASAGVDIGGYVQRMQVESNGTLWFLIDSPEAPKYCKPGWWEFNMYIPASHPQYAFYYGLLLTSLTKTKPIQLANISTFNGTEPCDISKTGYGIVLMK